MSSIKRIIKHFHTYERSAIKSDIWQTQVYRCKGPRCTHYTRAEFIEGKEIWCYKCGQITFAMKEQLQKRNKHIVCLMCSKSPKRFTVVTGKEVMEELLKTIEANVDGNGDGKDPIILQFEKDGKDGRSEQT